MQAPIPGAENGALIGQQAQVSPRLILQHSFQWALVGGGPHIAGKYDRVWRCALIYSLASSVLFSAIATLTEQERSQEIAAR